MSHQTPEISLEDYAAASVAAGTRAWVESGRAVGVRP